MYQDSFRICFSKMQIRDMYDKLQAATRLKVQYVMWIIRRSEGDDEKLIRNLIAYGFIKDSSPSISNSSTGAIFELSNDGILARDLTFTEFQNSIQNKTKKKILKALKGLLIATLIYLAGTFTTAIENIWVNWVSEFFVESKNTSHLNEFKTIVYTCKDDNNTDFICFHKELFRK